VVCGFYHAASQENMDGNSLKFIQYRATSLGTLGFPQILHETSKPESASIRVNQR
jgi:hypothetical protein